VYDAMSPSDPLSGAFTAWGVGGQYITVVPTLDMVVAHKTDTGFRQPGASNDRRQRAVSVYEYDAMLRMLIASKCSGAC
jgi:hypothetical protein